jgi:CRISPR-associated RAMP protein (TIGR02581 family)
MDASTFGLRHHAALERLVRFEIKITCTTGLHIGAGKSPDLAGSDLPVLRDASGRPLIPGSSLRGVLRAGLESLLPSLPGAPPRRPPAPTATATAGPSGPPARARELADYWGELDLVERLFGRVQEGRGDTRGSYGSRLQISDLLCRVDVAPELRDGVAIKRETRTAADSAKFDLEVVPAGTEFFGSVRLKNPADYEVGMVAQALWMLDAGVLLLGGKTARGLGWVKVEATPPVEIKPTDLLAGRVRLPSGPSDDDEFGEIAERLNESMASLAALALPAVGAAPSPEDGSQHPRGAEHV